MTAMAQGLERKMVGGSPVRCDSLDQARTLLERQRQALRRRVAEFDDDVDDIQTATATLGHGESELATRQISVELRVALDAASQGLLEDVERALGRLDDGTYGICAACGRNIGHDRLRALPQVDLCIGCQTSGERDRRQR